MKTILRLALGSVLTGAALTATAAPGELYVKFKPNASPALLNAGIGAKVVRSFPEIGWQVVTLPTTVSAERAKRYFRALSTVAAIEESVKRYKKVIPNDPLYGPIQGNIVKQYQHAQIGMPAAWELSLGSPSVTVAVIDSGTRVTHEDLVAQHRSDSFNAVNGGTDFSDPDGHGTHVAGCAVATANNGKGGLGTAWNARLLTIKISYSESGLDDYVAGVMYAANKNVQVINMSYGGPAFSQMENDALQYAFNRDIVLVAASGNENSSFAGYPAQYTNILSIGSTEQGGGKSVFSNFGAEVDVAAPGGQIVSTATSADSNYIVSSGTSMAAPVTAGAIALMRAYAPELPGTEIVAALKNTAVQGSDRFTVHGQINVAAAIASLSRPRIDDLNPSSASVVAQEGTVVNTTGSSTTDAAYLNDVDNSTLEIRSNYQPGLGTVAGITTDFSVTAEQAKIITSRLQMSVRAASGVTMLVMLQNPTTGAFEQFNSARLSAATSNFDFALPRVTLLKYLKSNKTVRVMVRAINPSRLAPGGVPFRASIDSIGLRVTVSTR